MEDKLTVLICNNCKQFYISPKQRCECGCTVLTETHASNLMFTKEFRDGCINFFGGKTNKKQ